MSSTGQSPDAGFAGEIHVMAYTHADIAWVHTRAWHIDRQVRVMGDETQIRRRQPGMRRWRELAPEIEFRVHSIIDVTCGHSQTPQLLTLAGLEAYFIRRPPAALDAAAPPRRRTGPGGTATVADRDPQAVT